jgi:hypothetical protein
VVVPLGDVSSVVGMAPPAGARGETRVTSPAALVGWVLAIARAPRKSPPSCLLAAQHWKSGEVLRHRRQLHPEFARRQKTGERRSRRGPDIGTLAPHQTEERKRLIKSDRYSIAARVLQVLVLYADRRTGRVGQWIHGQQQPLSRRGIATRAGILWSHDKRRASVIRCWQVDRALQDLVAAALIRRFQRPGRDGANEIAETYVTDLFWVVSGVEEVRQAELAELRRKGKLPAQPPPRRPRPAHVQDVVGRVARGAESRAVDSFGPNAPQVRPRSRPPPS